MRLLYFGLALGLPICGLAQGIVFGGGVGAGGAGSSSMSGFGLMPGRTVGINNLSVTLRTDPPTTAVMLSTASSYRGHGANGVSFFSRIVLDAAKHEYYGYEVTLVPQQSGTYLATFGKLGITPMEAAAEAGSTAKDWSLREVALPQPKVVQVGDALSIEFGVHPATGAKLIDDIQIQAQRQGPALGALGARAPASILAASTNALARGTPAAPAVPTADGTARDFTAGDAEMQVRQPRITLNGQQQPTTGRTPTIVTGTLIWFYLPGRGRYVLSLAPRPELGFRKAGELRGGSIKFTLGEDTITLECLNEIAPGHAPYNLYVLLDPQWEPTASGQKGQFAIGSVDAGELAKLKRQ